MTEPVKILIVMGNPGHVGRAGRLIDGLKNLPGVVVDVQYFGDRKCQGNNLDQIWIDSLHHCIPEPIALDVSSTKRGKPKPYYHVKRRW